MTSVKGPRQSQHSPRQGGGHADPGYERAGTDERPCIALERRPREEIGRGAREGSSVQVEDLVDGHDDLTRLGGVDGSIFGRTELASSGSIAWAIATLRQQGTPSREIAAILEADRGQLVRQYLELHRERLEEHLADQRRTLARLERLLVSRTSRTAARPRMLLSAGLVVTSGVHAGSAPAATSLGGPNRYAERESER
jgi:hypothetical protein